ncbi:FtsX-like permease family protein [Pseudonocardia oroxyli]|uniref:FtsX-like permease family protein n=1 Tax=Pseudonocardia oroxyli TaxID=366584 RepID=A0A1G7FQF5_PSEOR|nr:FtsX-like permease family protein [Pseudonocardia oroxyli]SDE78127.1 FtsX-like permease family protein [Pseudonocardia oroxyli]
MIGLSLRLLRLGGRRAWAAAGLVGAGVAVATALLMTALGALHGLDQRELRTGWRTPVAAQGDPVAQLRVRTDHAAGLPIVQVDLAALDAAAAPPPGLPRLPAPGEVWVSPALADLLHALPADALAERYPGPVTGEVGDAGLQRPDELVAVLGRAPDDPAFTAPGDSDVLPVAAFDRVEASSDALLYRSLTIVAVALVVFPVAGLLGASARLTATRRADRLATLRLLGASTRQVTTVAVAETTAVATAAAAVGVVLEWACAPLLARIPLAGGGWFTADLRPSWMVAVPVVLGVGALATLSAIGGLRRVVVSPLGVVRRQVPQRVRWIRLLGVAAALVVFGIVNAALRTVDVSAVGLVLAAGVLALFGACVLIGPLVVRVAGAWLVRRDGAASVIAGRRLLDDPRAAFRPVAGLTLAVFVAGFLAPLTAAVSGLSTEDTTTLHLRPAVVAPDLRDRAEQELGAAGIAAFLPPGTADEVLVRPGDPAVLDRARTLLGALVPGTLVQTEADRAADQAVLVGDMRRGAFVVLIGTFLVAATATGTAAAARVLDHRHTLRLLRLAGTPVQVLESARARETAAPLLVNGAIALGLGLFCASPFVAVSAVAAPSGLVLLGVVLLAGTATVAAATAASRPLLRAVTAADGSRG